MRGLMGLKGGKRGLRWGERGLRGGERGLRGGEWGLRGRERGLRGLRIQDWDEGIRCCLCRIREGVRIRGKIRRIGCQERRIRG